MIQIKKNLQSNHFLDGWMDGWVGGYFTCLVLFVLHTPLHSVPLHFNLKKGMVLVMIDSLAWMVWLVD